MKLNRSLLSAALAIAVLAGSNLVEARAGQITQIDSIGQTATPFSTVFNFNPYAGAPGTLTSVMLTVEATINGIVSVINISQVPQLVTSADISTLVTASSPAGNTMVNATTGITNQIVGPGQTNFTDLAGVVTNSTTYTGGFVNPFYGAVAIPVAINSGAGIVTGTTTPTGGTLFFGGSVTSAVKVTLVYNFSDIVIPEPTSGAMFGIGIVLAMGLGWGRKRRELNKLAA